MGTNKGVHLVQLELKNVSLAKMLEAAMTLYVPCNKVDSEKTKMMIEDRLTKEIKKQLEDPNVGLLIEAAIYLDDRHRLDDAEKETGPSFIVADELIGMLIAEYIGGKKALFNFVRYDQKKPGILSELDVFLDDAIAGLIAGSMSKVFEDWK